MADKNLKKIGLVICMSNFESHQYTIKSIHKVLKKIGNCVMYVFTNYGIFADGQPYDIEKVAVYNLLDSVELDGCIIEGNIGSSMLVDEIAAKLRRRSIPFVTFNTSVEGNPFLSADSYRAQIDLLEQLIDFHHCKKINLVVLERKDLISFNMLQAYRKVFEERKIDFDENRIIRKDVSVENGREVFDICVDRGIIDADAMVFAHDVLAMSFCEEYMSRGYRIPDDMKLCSLNCSTNSIVFRPSITGIGYNYDEMAGKVCDLLFKRMVGEEIPMENYYPGTIIYGESCPGPFGLSDCSDSYDKYRNVVFNKVGVGNQMSRILSFNGELEDVDSFEDYGNSVHRMMMGIGCREYFCVVNPDAADYIMDEESSPAKYRERTFEDNMLVLTGTSRRGKNVKNMIINISSLVPVTPRADDIFIVNPIGNKNGCFGYMVLLNNYTTIESYNYRICHDFIGMSMENLHRQMVLRRSIAELDELHMTDPMTGLYNRFAIKRFIDNYFKAGRYAVVMIDMDGLKKVNDTYGHLAGNNAINITATSIKSCAGENDLVTRYGGDEFVIISNNTDLAYWESIHQAINSLLKNEVELQKLPYKLGISLGAAVSEITSQIGLEACCEVADRRMYENKRKRKAAEKNQT